MKFLSSTLAAIAILAPATATGANLFGLINTGELFSSTNNGVTWTPLSTLPVRDATALAARLSSSDLFLASRSGSIYRSTDAGASWTAVGAISASDVEDFAIRPDGALLVLTATGSLYLSTDQGLSFTALAALTGSNFVSLSFTTPAVKYYALTRTGEVYESTDNGSTWTPKGALAISNARRIRALQTTLYVLTETGDVFRSTDAAASWTAVGTLSQVGMRGLVRNGASLAAASKEGHVATSVDGTSWTWQGSMNQLSLTALASNEPATTGVAPALTAGSLSLSAPWPNPARVSAGFDFTLRLSAAQEASFELHDVAGRRVASRPAEVFAAGSSTIHWAPAVPGAGLYLLSMTTPGRGAATRVVVIP